MVNSQAKKGNNQAKAAKAARKKTTKATPTTPQKPLSAEFPGIQAQPEALSLESFSERWMPTTAAPSKKQRNLLLQIKKNSWGMWLTQNDDTLHATSLLFHKG